MKKIQIDLLKNYVQPKFKEDFAEKIFSERHEIIDLFCKTFLATEVQNLETFKSGSLLLVEQRGEDGLSSTYRCEFFPYEEIEKQKKELIKHEAMKQLIAEAVAEERKRFEEEGAKLLDECNSTR